MGKPAARLTDMHTCPMVTPGTPPIPHVGGPISGPCVPPVLIGFLPAATVGDMCVCVGPPDSIIMGSPTVFIGGKMAARIGDPTAHGGVIVVGCPTVLIGESGGGGASVSALAVVGGQNDGSGDAVPGAPDTVLAAEIDKRLDEANWISDDDEARKIVDKLTDEQIKSLPSSTRNRLMETLYSGYYSDADKAAMNKLYNVRFVDPSFDKVDRENRQKLQETLRQDADIQHAKANWANLSEKERLDALNKATDHQAQVYGFSPSSVSPYNKEPFVASDGKTYVENGYYNHSDGKLHINTSSKGSHFDSFDKTMDTAIHENAHRQQNDMADRFEAGKIDKSSHEYEQARTFSINRKTYVHEPYDIYENQPMEHHSRVNGAAAQSI